MHELYRQAAKKIREAGNILLVSHVMPDGDNIGSLLGMLNSLRLSGYDVDAANTDPVPAVFNFLHGAEGIMRLSDVERRYDLLIVLDASSVERTGAADLAKYSDFVINIDHHVCNDNFGDINIVFTDYSSTVQIVYELLRAGRFKMDAGVASCLYCGLMTDTVGFQTASTNESVFKMAAHLVSLGASPNSTSREIFQNRSLPSVVILGKTLSSLNFINNNTICWSKVEWKTVRDAGGGPGDSFGAVNQMLAIRGVEVAVLFHEQKDGKVILDFRSKSVIDVNKVANHFGGGGHMRASGATVTGELTSVISEVINYTVDYINNNYRVNTVKGKPSVEAISQSKPKSSKKTSIRESVGL